MSAKVKLALVATLMTLGVCPAAHAQGVGVYTGGGGPAIDVGGGGVSVNIPGGVSVDVGGAETGAAPVLVERPRIPAKGPMPAQSYINANLPNMDFSHKNLVGALFGNATLDGSRFTGSNLAHAKFTNASLRGVDFSGANLASADLSNTDMSGANLSGAILTNANLTNATIDGANITGAVLDGAILANVDMGRAVNGPVKVIVQQQRPAFVDARGISAALVSQQRKVDLTVNFDFNSDKLTRDGAKQVAEIATALNGSEVGGARIMVEGHTDNVGSDSYNDDLSYRRAMRVVRTLVDQYGVPAERLSAKGYGESRPVASNDSEIGRAMNRRVTLVNLGGR